jgi:hypothetical protein
MNFYFDYIYYRLTQLYFKWDGREGITAILAISMIQCLLIGDLGIFFLRLVFDRAETQTFSSVIASVGAVICIALIVYNYFKYRRKYNQFKSYWKNESRSRRFAKGILIILSLVTPWIPIVLMGTLW